MTETEKIILQSQRTILLGLSAILSVAGPENQTLVNSENRMREPMHPLLSATHDQLKAAMLNITIALNSDPTPQTADVARANLLPSRQE